MVSHGFQAVEDRLGVCEQNWCRTKWAYMTKSMLPSSSAHRLAASTSACGCYRTYTSVVIFGGLNIFPSKTTPQEGQRTSRTSQPPIPMTLAPGRAVAMSAAMRSVFSTFRPMMAALAPRATRARVWAEQMDPAPPVTKATLPAVAMEGMLLADVVMAFSWW